MKIRNLELGKYPLFLAPMEDITDPSFRYICKKFGADVMYTEFISSDGLIRNGIKSAKKLRIFDYERPIGIQLYGHLPDSMIEATRIAEKANPDLIDINYGCPVRKISNRGAGAGMLNNIPLLLEMTGAIVRSTHLPVTVKTRLGWDEGSIVIVDLAEKLQDKGIEAITIHARTRSQLYNGIADWTCIGEVKNNPRIRIPVIGNGDVTSPRIAREMFDKYQVDGIMIGRAAVGKPWIFRNTRQFLESGKDPGEPTLDEKIDIATEHLKKSVEFKGLPVGVLEMRRHLSNYFKGLPHFREIRYRLLTAPEPSQVIDILEEIRRIYRGYTGNSADAKNPEETENE